MAMLSLTFGILAGKKSAVASAGLARNLRKDIFEKVQGFLFKIQILKFLAKPADATALFFPANIPKLKL